MRQMTSLVVLALLSGLASADIPQVISYQGKVTDTSGNPVADGSYTMRFRIYDAVTGGTLLWDSGARTVSVAGGIFSVLLGETPQPALNLAFDDDYWLLVTFSGVDQTPRQRLASAGYAYMASGLVAGTEVSGSVGLGTLAAIKGTNTAPSGAVYGVAGQCLSTSGRGVYGKAEATTGTTYGVYGRSESVDGTGVYGYASASAGTTNGVYGKSSSPDGRGVYGSATDPAGGTYGGFFEIWSPGGNAVYGRAWATTGGNIAVYGRNDSNEGYGVFGSARCTTGVNYGVYGRSYSSAGYGIVGTATAATGETYGVYGASR